MNGSLPLVYSKGFFLPISQVHFDHRLPFGRLPGEMVIGIHRPRGKQRAIPTGTLVEEIAWDGRWGFTCCDDARTNSRLMGDFDILSRDL
jgi:hypothetical protein